MYQGSQNIDLRHSDFHAGRDQYNVFGPGAYLGHQFHAKMAERRCSHTFSRAGIKTTRTSHHGASARTTCLPGTRVNVLKDITDWVSDAECSQRVLWVCGLAGSGKSAISTAIADHYRDTRTLGAFLFFDRDVSERNDPTRVVKTMAYQLGSFHPEIGKLISAAIDSNPAALLSRIPFQFQKFVVEPLSSFELAIVKSPIVLVLDALDECGNADTREALLALLAIQSSALSSAFRFIITSRSEPDISTAFHHQLHIRLYEVDIRADTNNDDITSYFREKMGAVCTRKRFRDWPKETDLQVLTKKACGLFVWASTASKFINAHDPRKRMDIILKGDATSGAENALDVLYQTALQSVRSPPNPTSAHKSSDKPSSHPLPYL